MDAVTRIDQVVNTANDAGSIAALEVSVTGRVRFEHTESTGRLVGGYAAADRLIGPEPLFEFVRMGLQYLLHIEGSRAACAFGKRVEYRPV